MPESIIYNQMGCQSSRVPESSQEETIVTQAESLLSLTKLNSGTLDKAFSRFSNGVNSGPHELKEALDSLGIDNSFLEDSQSPIKKFFDSLKIPEENLYSVKALCCLGILLGKETPQKKASLLFQNYDRDCSNYIDKKELANMIYDIHHISLGLVQLAIEFFKAKKLNNYKSKLESARLFSENALKLMLTSGMENYEIEKEEFVSKFSSKDIRKCTSASGYRLFCLEFLNAGKFYDLI